MLFLYKVYNVFMDNGCYFYFAHIYSKIHTESQIYTLIITPYLN